jgi:hypothetical protein
MPKLAKNIGSEKNNIVANEVRQHALRCPCFFSFVGGWRCWDFCCSQYVSKLKVLFCTLCPHNSGPCHIKLGQKWWPTQMKIEFFLNQWGEAICIQEAQFFSHRGKMDKTRWDFFKNLVFPNAFCVVPLCSHQVLNDYLICSQFVPQVSNMFPIPAHFIPYVLPKVFF